MATFDRRIVLPSTLRFLQVCHARTPFHLAGGTALSGVHLRHRLSRDADLFFHDRQAHRDAVALLPEVALDAGVTIRIVRDAGTFVRGVLSGADGELDIDLVCCSWTAPVIRRRRTSRSPWRKTQESILE